jgi:maltooligosyltrehalose trehalohydrolase
MPGPPQRADTPGDVAAGDDAPAPVSDAPRHGAFPVDDRRTRFSVWAPRAANVDLVVTDRVTATLDPVGGGYHQAVAEAPPGTRYRYRLDGRGPFADPASRDQPEGVHGPSAVPARRRADVSPRWRGLPMSAYVVCEVHVGTFSAAGTFDGVADGLDHLAGAGYTAIELMPVWAFPGKRNWGYDGVFPFAVHAGYGGREGLIRLNEAAHGCGMAVVLDVVYNHFGPEGCVLEEFGPYTTDRYRTPWGPAVNVDGEGSDEVRRFFVEQALSVVRELGADGLRLDAVHEIPDQTASPFVAELQAALAAESRRLGRTITVVAESPSNDSRLVTPARAGGLGLDGVWNDDFHHALRVALTGQSDRYFGDYRGTADLASALTDGFVVTGRYAPSRGRRHGARPPQPLGGDRLVVFAQNHDQIGNGGYGRRLADELPLEAQFPVAAAVLCSGWVPLRFMGEEYGETAPFHFFTDYGDPALVQAVREGRRSEIGAQAGPESHDPQDPATFEACRPDPSLAAQGMHRQILSWQRLLLELRRREPALGTMEPERSTCWFDETNATFALVRRAARELGGRPVVIVASLHGEATTPSPSILEGARLWVLAARGAGAMAAGDTVVPDAAGRVHLALEAFGVVVAAVEEPVPAGTHGVRAGTAAPRRP